MIEAKVDLTNKKSVNDCISKSYRCTYNETTLDTQSIHVGRPPAAIEFQRNFKCFLYDLSEKYCEFKPISGCDRDANYRLFVQVQFMVAECKLKKRHDTFFFNSSGDEGCYFPNSDGVKLILNATNDIGNRMMHFNVNHDFVKPKDVYRLNITVTDTGAVVQNNQRLKVKRSLEYQLQLISKYSRREESIVSDKELNYTLNDLYPFTKYELRVRLRVIPRSPRLFEDEYCSNWSRTDFKTHARKPDRFPRTISGAFSFKNQKSDRASIEVFWEPLQEYEWNGPGFRYNISAVSDTGQWYFPVIDANDNSMPNEMVTFEYMTIAHYQIMVSCFNDLGSTQSLNAMEVFPPNPDLKPKIKNVSSNRQTFTISWFPPQAKKDLTNYTVMYCNLTSSSSCKDSIRFATVPNTNSSFHVISPTVLNFAVSANYLNTSSEFSWQQCIVTPSADIGSPQFDLSNITDKSFDIRITTPCSSSSLYETLDIFVLSKTNSVVHNLSFDQPVDRISFPDLSPNTEYTVKVVALDEHGNHHETSSIVQTLPKFTKAQLTLFFLCGMLLIAALSLVTTRKVKSIMNIYVEMPDALQTLLGIDEERKNLTEESHKKVDLNRIRSEKHNVVQIVIPEEDDPHDGRLLQDEISAKTGDAADTEVKKSVQISTAFEELKAKNVPIVHSNGYVLAAQFMTPKESTNPSLPENMKTGSITGYVAFK